MIDMLEQRSALQKIPVECRTCGVSEAFYSNLSVDKFKARHSGHDVVSGSPSVAKVEARHSDVEVVSENDEMTPPPTAPEAMPAPVESEPLAGETGIKVAKVMVDVLNFPSLGGPMVRVRGFDSALDEAFTATLLLEEGATIREMFEKGRYLDQAASGLLYTWEPDVVEYVDDAKAKVETLGDAQTKEATTEPLPDSSASEVVEQTTVASAAEVVIDAVLEEEAGRVEAESPPELPELASPSPTIEEDFQVTAPPAPLQSTPAPPLEPEPSKTSQLVAAVSAPKTTVKTTPEVASNRSEETGEDGYLLVSKSWYIQGGTGNRKEALRVSKVLKAFRWNVEPVYTIGVILDDMLSIETSRSQISGTLIKRIEAAGYRLTAVVTDKGKPAAWFKKEGSETALPTGGAGAGSDDSEMELEPDVTG